MASRRELAGGCIVDIGRCRAAGVVGDVPAGEFAGAVFMFFALVEVFASVDFGDSAGGAFQIGGDVVRRCHAYGVFVADRRLG